MFSKSNSAPVFDSGTTQFVDDQQLVSGELLLEAPQVLFVPCLDQFSDQSGGGDEANAMTALTNCQAERQGDGLVSMFGEM
jgi:hypothetical protein